MDVEELLARHAIDPAALEPAPADTSRQQVIDRICAFPPRPCSVCGEPSPTARMRVFPGHGPRWVDLCRDHSLAVIGPWRGPSTVEGILADLREAAAELGLPLQIWTDTGGWRDET
jgi:hypothetical protein